MIGCGRPDWIELEQLTIQSGMSNISSNLFQSLLSKTFRNGFHSSFPLDFRHITLDCERSSAGFFFDHASRFPSALFWNVSDDHTGTFTCKRKRCSPTDSASRSSDKSNFPIWFFLSSRVIAYLHHLQPILMILQGRELGHVTRSDFLAGRYAGCISSQLAVTIRGVGTSLTSHLPPIVWITADFICLTSRTLRAKNAWDDNSVYTTSSARYILHLNELFVIRSLNDIFASYTIIIKETQQMEVELR